MNQYVHIPTRENNILDLFISNNPHLVTNVSSSATHLSDHNLVDIMISCNPSSTSIDEKPDFLADEFRSLDYSRADFDTINKKLESVNWENLRSKSSSEEFPELFTSTLLNICLESIPRKKVGKGKPKVLNGLRRKKQRLKNRIEAMKSRPCFDQAHLANLERQLALVVYEIKESYDETYSQREQAAVAKIKKRPKCFYSYAKSFSAIKSNIAMLINNLGDVVTDREKMANMFQKQFTSVFSDPSAPDVKSPTFDPPHIANPMADEKFVAMDDAILEAISELENDSAPGPDGVPAVLLKNCAKEICKPLKIIWSESIVNGIVPAYYKTSFVSPIHKKDNRAVASNYRPVSLTSHVIKTFERIVRKWMITFLEENNILCNNQHGFRSGRSCLTQMLSHFNDVFLGLIDDKDTDSIYLDYAKAFDKVDHGLLVQKLEKYGFPPILIQWIKSFLIGRTQTVVVNGKHSVASNIISGVPQGTVLGPILFILFINDMHLCIKDSTVRLFADDSRILKSIGCEEETKCLQNDLNSAVTWSKANNMELHENKFELLVHKANIHSELVHLPFTIENYTYSVSGNIILYPSNQLKDLGVMVSPDLSWTPHINTITSRARSITYWVLSVFKTREKNTMITLYKSLIRSHLEYCCPLWHPSKIGDIQELESVQRTFTARISGMNDLNYWDRLKSLQLMSMQRRRERYIIMHMWKTLHDQCPNDLQIKFMKPSRLGIRATIPPCKKMAKQRNQTLYEHSFAVLGPRLWNTLPKDLSTISCKQEFKDKLTRHVLSIPDFPPVRGYTGPNNNSLLDWNQNKAVSLQSGWLATMACLNCLQS